MSDHYDRFVLRHMLDHAVEAIEFSQGRSVTDFASDRMWSLAIVRLLYMVGETASRISGDSQERLSRIPWPEISWYRVRIADGYDAIDYDRAWAIIQTELPVLVKELEALNLPEFD